MKTGHFKTKVAIIGLGNIGETIASNLIKGNHNVIIASRDFQKAKSFADQLGPLATAKEVVAAIREADVVIPAIYFNSLKDFFQTYFRDLEHKMIIDVSNPIAPAGNGGFKKIIAEDESAGKILSHLVPKTAVLVKAFGTLGAVSLKNAAFSQPEPKVLFYASDSTNRNAQIEELITSSGFAPYHIGGLDQSRRIEVFGELHEFGPLGKTITIKEFNQSVKA